MKKITVIYLWLVIIMGIVILIPYIQNAGDGPSSSGISFFMGYTQWISDVYLSIISMGMLEGALIILFLQSLFQDIKEKEPNKFDLSK